MRHGFGLVSEVSETVVVEVPLGSNYAKFLNLMHVDPVGCGLGCFGRTGAMLDAPW
jgi:hypothetical protein